MRHLILRHLVGTILPSLASLTAVYLAANHSDLYLALCGVK